jgi:hypothetical protein
MVRRMMKVARIATLALGIVVEFLSTHAHAQNTYNKFAPANGVLKGSTTTYVTTAAASADIITMWSGTCSATTYLSGTGVCSTPAGTGGGTVNSVSQTVPQGLCISGSPVTNVGTLAITWCTGETNHQVLGTGLTGQVELITLTAADLPSIPTSQLTGTVSTTNGGTGEAGTFTGVRKANSASADTAATSADVVGLWSGTCSSSTFLNGAGACATPASGSVTSVGWSWTGSGLTVGGTPVTSSGTIAVSGTLNAASGGTGEAGTVTGLLKGNATSAQTAAVASDVYGLWSGTCSSSTFLRGDGACASPSGVSGANPTATVGPTANNGSATTYMRSDASPAQCLTCSYAWTGNHTFTPGSGVGITVNGAAGVFSEEIVASSTTGSSDGLVILAGTNSSDTALDVQNRAGSANYFLVHGDGSGGLGATAGALTWNASGNVVVAPPSIGSALAVTGIAGSTAVNIAGGTTTGSSFGLTVTAGTNTSDDGVRVFNASGSTEQFAVRGDGATLMGFGGGGDVFNSNGVITFGAPTAGAGTALTVSGTANDDSIRIIGSSTSGQSLGLDILAGTSSADYGLRVLNQTASTTFFTVAGDGGVVLGTASDLGAGTLDVPNSVTSTAIEVIGNNPSSYTGAAILLQYSGGGFVTSTSNATSASGTPLTLRGSTITLSSGSTFGSTGIIQGSDGGVTVGGPTGGDKGLGSINVQSCFVNNLPCLTGANANKVGGAVMTSSGGNTCVVNQNNGGIASCSEGAAGNINVTFSTSYFATSAVCTSSGVNGGSVPLVATTQGTFGGSGTLNVTLRTPSNTFTDGSFTLVCMGN